MKSYQVVRTHLSPYQGTQFTHIEKVLLESIGGIEYRNLGDLDAAKEIILITNTHTRLREIPSEVLKRTKLIVHPNSGYDHFSEDRSLWTHIPVVIGHSIRAQAVAEYSLGCVFEGLVELPQHLLWSKSREWGRTLLHGQRVLVFGYGHIGKKVADTLATLGMKVTVCDPFIKTCPHDLVKSWKDAPVRDVRAVIMCCGLNSSSRHIVSKDFLTQLPVNVLIVNGARGPLIDEKALREHLLSHPASFAFLDVFEEEPFSEEWVSFPQVWKTSHVAGVHAQLDQGILDFEKQVIEDFFQKDFLKKYERELLASKFVNGELV
jgi:D-3-phosphoglycerate dehydrogenase / 2-oxoglutarate reductase